MDMSRAHLLGVSFSFDMTMKRILAVVALLSLLSCGTARQSGSERLMDRPIIGTHDAAAYQASPQLKCQDLTLKEQLEAGVRAFDLRLVDRYDGSGRLDLYHGEEHLGLEFTEQVLPLFSRFLTDHPDEFVILSLKKEDTRRSTPEDMAAYATSVRSALTSPLIYDGPLTKETTVEEVKGRMIVLLRTRIGEEVCLPYFDGFCDDTTFTARLINPCGGAMDILVEDDYMVEDTIGMTDKVEAVRSVLDRSESHPDHWMITYLSGTGATTPERVAEVVTPATYQILSERDRLPGGIYFMDFVGSESASEIIKLLRKD